MSGSTLVLVELLLVLGGVMAWAVWELWTVRRMLREDRERMLRMREQQPADTSPHQRFD